MDLKKAYHLTVCLLFITCSLKAQNPENPSPFVFSKYVHGVVLQKAGGKVNALLNYNTFTQEMMFEDNGKRLVLDQISNIDTVYLEHRKFIPSHNVFLEKLTNTPVTLYVQHVNKAIYKPGNWSDNNSVVSDNYKKKEVKTIDPYALQLPDHYRLQSESKYWIKKGSKLIQLTSVRKLTDQFPDKATQIEDYIKKENINLSVQDDLMKLVEFCNR